MAQHWLMHALAQAQAQHLLMHSQAKAQHWFTEAPACADRSEGGRRGPLGAAGGRFPRKVGFLSVFGLRSCPDGSGQPIRFIWSLFRAKRSILDPFRTKFDVFGPDRTLADVADMSRRDPTSPDG